MPPQQPLGVGEIPLAPARRSIRVGLRQKQFAMTLQLLPHWLPVLRGRLHHGLAHILFVQPHRQRFQFAGGGAELTPLELELALARHVADHHGQHAFVYVNSCNQVGPIHAALLCQGTPVGRAMKS